jgi:hypothetical protein
MRHPGIERFMRGVVSRSGQAGMRAFRKGCNRRWDSQVSTRLSSVSRWACVRRNDPAIYRGDSYRARRPEFSSKIGNRIVELKNMENEAAG